MGRSVRRVADEHGVIWDSAVTTAAKTAIAFQGIVVDATAGAFSITLPTSPAINDVIALRDAASTFSINNLVVVGNGANIDGAASSLLTLDGASKIYTWTGAEWKEEDSDTSGSVRESTPIGSIIQGDPNMVSPNYLKLDGSIILKSAYPDLVPILGNSWAGWSNTNVVSPSVPTGAYSDAVVDIAGTIMVVYKDVNVPTSLLFWTKSTDGGATWSTPISIAGTSASYWVILMLGNAAGTFHILTTDNFTAGGTQAVNYGVTTTDGGATWSTPTILGYSDGIAHVVFPTYSSTDNTFYLWLSVWNSTVRGFGKIAGASFSGTVTVLPNPYAASPNPDAIASLPIITPDGSAIICYTYYNGMIARSVNQGTSWSLIQLKDSSNQVVSRITLHASGPAGILVFDDTAPGSDVFISTNQGASWQPRAGLLSPNATKFMAFYNSNSTNYEIWDDIGTIWTSADLVSWVLFPGTNSYTIQHGLGSLSGGPTHSPFTTSYGLMIPWWSGPPPEVIIASDSATFMALDLVNGQDPKTASFIRGK